MSTVFLEERKNMDKEFLEWWELHKHEMLEDDNMGVREIAAAAWKTSRKKANMFDNLLLNYQKEWVDNPDFDNNDRVHNWRNYVPDVFKKTWNSLPIETRQVIIIMAEERSDSEEWD